MTTPFAHKTEQYKNLNEHCIQTASGIKIQERDRFVQLRKNSNAPFHILQARKLAKVTPFSMSAFEKTHLKPQEF